MINMRKNDEAIQIEFVCPKALAAGLEQLAQAQYSSKSAVLRQLIAQAMVNRPAEVASA
jgi:hypothetical protein